MWQLWLPLLRFFVDFSTHEHPEDRFPGETSLLPPHGEAGLFVGQQMLPIFLGSEVFGAVKWRLQSQPCCPSLIVLRLLANNPQYFCNRNRLVTQPVHRPTSVFSQPNTRPVCTIDRCLRLCHRGREQSHVHPCKRTRAQKSSYPNHD